METYPTIKGQIVIPSSLRRKYGITTTTKIRIFEENDRIVLQPITREYIQKLRGKFKGSGILRVLQEERERERDL